MLLTVNKPSIIKNKNFIRLFHNSYNASQKIKMGEDQPKYHVPNQKEQRSPIKYRTHGTSFYQLKLPMNYRLGNLPIYQNPLINFVTGSKRLSLAFAGIGCVFAYLMDKTGLIWTEFSQLVAIFSLFPFPIVTYLFEPYVARIWKVYDTTKPQTIENLTKDETIILEKLNWSGFKTYNELVRVDSLCVPSGKTDYRGRFGFVNLLSIDEKSGSVKSYYINDGFCNVKMDRIMSLAERKSGILKNGRSFFKEMKVVIQKAKQASVTVDNEVISKIGKGLMLLVGISTDDTKDDVEKLANKILKLKLFEDMEKPANTTTDWVGKPWQKSIVDINGEILSVSQFTLYANVKKGAKPDFHKAQKGQLAVELYELFLNALKSGLGDESKVQDGQFGAMMDVSLINDGPVTIIYDTKDK